MALKCAFINITRTCRSHLADIVGLLACPGHHNTTGQPEECSPTNAHQEPLKSIKEALQSCAACSQLRVTNSTAHQMEDDRYDTPEGSITVMKESSHRPPPPVMAACPSTQVMITTCNRHNTSFNKIQVLTTAVCVCVRHVPPLHSFCQQNTTSHQTKRHRPGRAPCEQDSNQALLPGCQQPIGTNVQTPRRQPRHVPSIVTPTSKPHTPDRFSSVE